VQFSGELFLVALMVILSIAATRLGPIGDRLGAILGLVDEPKDPPADKDE